MENSAGNNPFRFLRPWEKKRGDRSTGSRLVGRVGEAMFFAMLFLLGAAPAAVLLTSQIIEPNPELLRFGFGFYLMLLVLLSFIFIGGVGFLYSLLEMGASAERRSALAKAASGLDILEEAGGSPRGFPTVPRGVNLINSPGVKLSYRLPTDQSKSWRLITAAMLSIVWCVVAAGLIVAAVEAHCAGSPQWMLTLFSVPFLGIALWSVYYFFRQLLLQTGVGPTIVEVSDHPFFPGQHYEMCVNQSGRLNLRTLEAWLVCEEQATYRQGTDVRTEVREVLRRRIFEKHEIPIDPGMPFQFEHPLITPRGVMHSFAAKNNAISWKIVICGLADSWPPFERSFPVTMFPENSMAAAKEIKEIKRNRREQRVP